MTGFLDFIRERAVVGLAVGFILGTAVSGLVSAFITDIVNPLLGIVLGAAEGLRAATVTIAGAKLLWGDFVVALIDFLVVAFVVYIGVKILHLDRLDKKESSSAPITFTPPPRR